MSAGIHAVYVYGRILVDPFEIQSVVFSLQTVGQRQGGAVSSGTCREICSVVAGRRRFIESGVYAPVVWQGDGLSWGGRRNGVGESELPVVERPPDGI